MDVETTSVAQMEAWRWLMVFPEEIWLKILYSVDDPGTHYNCAQASSYWAVLLKPKETTFQFYEVLKLLVHLKYVRQEDGNQILKCRLVCSSWTTAVDHFLQSRNLLNKRTKATAPDQYSEIANVESLCGVSFNFYKFNLRFIERVLLPEFSTELYQRHNPFSSRHLDLMQSYKEPLSSDDYPPYSPVNRTDYFWQLKLQRYHLATQKLLRNVGHHVWHLRLYITNVEQGYELLQSYFELLPNLKCAHVTFPPPKVKLVLHKGIVKAAPFPTLKKLDWLKLENVPCSEVERLRCANKSVKIITASPSPFMEKEILAHR